MALGREPVKTSTQQEVPIPHPAAPLTGETAAQVGAGALLLVLAIGWLRRRLSRDSSQIEQDRAEGLTAKMLLEVNKALAAENERLSADAREAWSRTNGDAGLIGHLRAENEYLKTQLGAAQATISQIRQGVQQVGQKVDGVQGRLLQASKNIDSGHVPLD